MHYVDEGPRKYKGTSMCVYSMCHSKMGRKKTTTEVVFSVLCQVVMCLPVFLFVCLRRDFCHRKSITSV